MSANHVQEFQFSKISDGRKKIDGKYMKNATEMIWQKDENSLEYKSKNDDRKSLAWDSAFFTSPGILDPEELFERLNFQDVEHGVNAPGIVPSESMERERAKGISEFNTRRSLAWDSAFFTSAGVLDPEELFMVNKGFKKSATHVLPEIEEEFWRSGESNSLIYRDGSSLASVGIGLFDDSKAYNVTTSSSKLGRGNGLQNTHSLKKLEASSRVKGSSHQVNPKRQSLNKHGSDRNAKAAFLPPQSQHVARGGYCSPSSSLKPPKVSGRQFNSLLTTLSKRASSGPNIRIETKATKAAPGQTMTVSKRPGLGKSSPKSPSLSSHTPTNKYARLGSALSDSAGRSPLSSLRKKNDSGVAASGSLSPLKNLRGNKIELLNSSLPSDLLPSFKSFCTSPASSIDIWSSDSSSINQNSNNSTESLDMTYKEICSDGDASQASDSGSHICEQNCFTYGDQDKRVLNQQDKKISLENTSVYISRNIKPSGLRMPSPKIGFFDAENSMAQTPNGDMKFHSAVPSSSCKTGRAIANYNGDATRTMRSKPQSAGTLSNIGFQQTGDPCHPLCTRPSRPPSFEEDKGNKGFMKIEKGMKREDKDSRRAKMRSLKKHKDANKQSPWHIFNDDDKENLCSFHNQVDGLSKHIEAISFNQDLAT